MRRPLLLLLAAAGCLLLLGCVNLANLLVARNHQRRGELGLRLALGCSPERLVRQLLVEGGLIAGAGALVGLAAAWAGLRLLLAAGAAWMPEEVMRALTDLRVAALGWGTLAFTVGLACLTLVLFALGPALGAAKWDLRARMAEHHLTGAARRLVAVEMALATVLALGAGLLGHSFAALTGVNPGFQAAGRMHFWVGLPSGRCHGPDVACFHAEWAAGAVYMNQLEGQLRALPGVTAASATGTVPMDPSNGPPMPHGPENLIQVFPMMVTPGYFDVMGARLMEGRDFNSGDKIGAPRRIIVNQAFVRRFLAGVPPIGRQVAIARCEINNTDPRHRCTIIGVVADLHEDSLALTPQPAAYVSFNQDPTPNLNFVLRSSLPTGTVMAEVERLLPQLPLYEGQHPFVLPPRTLDSTVAASVAAPRFRAWLSGLLAALAMALAGVGIFGVQSYAVTRRVSEIGTRMALGARPGDVVWQIVRESLGLALVGAALGLLGGLAGERWLAGLLFRVPAWDPETLLGAVAALLATAALAAWVPARRAAQVDAARALRAE